MITVTIPEEFGDLPGLVELDDKLDRKSLKNMTLAPGKYTLERVANPFNLGKHWLMVKDTKLGMHENAWRQWESDITITKTP